MSGGKSLRRAIDEKCHDCGGREGGAHFWRIHVAAFSAVTCPLWAVRPICSRNAPAWISSRKVADLPPGFNDWPLDKALAAVRGARSVLHPEKGNNSEAQGEPAPDQPPRGWAAS
jgi:hypothetical protein